MSMSRVQNETEMRDSHLYKETDLVRDGSMTNSSKDEMQTDR